MVRLKDPLGYRMLREFRMEISGRIESPVNGFVEGIVPKQKPVMGCPRNFGPGERRRRRDIDAIIDGIRYGG